MVLKTKDYFENTVKKIGYLDSEDYFYELDKKPKNPTVNPNSSSLEAENKTNWGKIVLVGLLVVIPVFLSFLIIKWINKKSKK